MANWAEVPFRGQQLRVSRHPLPPALDAAAVLSSSPDAYDGFAMPGLDTMEMCEDDAGGAELQEVRPPRKRACAALATARCLACASPAALACGRTRLARRPCRLARVQARTRSRLLAAAARRAACAARGAPGRCLAGGLPPDKALSGQQPSRRAWAPTRR
jgi:hypothetical protein